MRFHPASWLEQAFREVYTRMKNNITEDTRRVIFKFSATGMEKPVYYNVLPDFSFDQLWANVSSVCQSARIYDVNDDSMTVEYSMLKAL